MQYNYFPISFYYAGLKTIMVHNDMDMSAQAREFCMTLHSSNASAALSGYLHLTGFKIIFIKYSSFCRLFPVIQFFPAFFQAVKYTYTILLDGCVINQLKRTIYGMYVFIFKKTAFLCFLSECN